MVKEGGGGGGGRGGEEEKEKREEEEEEGRRRKRRGRTTESSASQVPSDCFGLAHLVPRHLMKGNAWLQRTQKSGNDSKSRVFLP